MKGKHLTYTESQGVTSGWNEENPCGRQGHGEADRFSLLQTPPHTVSQRGRKSHSSRVLSTQGPDEVARRLKQVAEHSQALGTSPVACFFVCP